DGIRCRDVTGVQTCALPISEETLSHVEELIAEHGSNVWFEREAKDLLPEGFTHPSSPNGEFTKETDIMDVWFDSGSSHEAVLKEIGRASCRARVEHGESARA